ncbi:kinase-like protein [Rhizophagus irregularis]|nr:kinase-like protein [Rhizophagus irregularis]
MELVKLNEKNSFDPTPRLKSSPVPIFFVSFDWRDDNCIHCGEKYTKTISKKKQKYCKNCLSRYLTNITDNDIYLDVYFFTEDLKCNEHEISRTKVHRNIQECCRNCLKILFFKQIIYFNSYYSLDFNTKMIESEKYCKLCGKLLYQGTDCHIMEKYKWCSDCYLISSGCIESTLTKKPISIIYLPWWENSPRCFCYDDLIFTSNCQKYCENCFIFFIGCRYCLTTNIIFGITNQSQCKKCKRVSTIILDSKKIISINSGKSVLDDFLVSIRSYQLEIAKFTDVIKNVDKYFVPYKICCNLSRFSRKFMKYIPYSQFTNVKKIAEGGFSIVYQATLLDGMEYYFWTKNGHKNIFILKRFKNSQYAKKYFLRELKSNYYSFTTDRTDSGNPMLIETFGFTKDPRVDGLDSYILVMEYAQIGDLHNYLQMNFTKIDWREKIFILYNLTIGLLSIHDTNLIHRDLHSGNMLITGYDCKIGDLGLSQSANDTLLDNEIYGVIPYIAPEIFMGSAFSKESDIYSLGMIMWELTTGCKPFANVEHGIDLIIKIIDGARPEITEDTIEWYANLMKSCWDPDPKKRPSIDIIKDICKKWDKREYDGQVDQVDQADLKRKKLIDSKKLGPEFSEKSHPNAIYTSKLLSSYISKCSSIFSKCSSINSSSKDYISNELEFDIDIKSSRLDSLGTKRNIEELNINSCENNGKYFI